MWIISITGGSGSGKTTISQQLAAKYASELVGLLPMDAYYKDFSHLSAEEKILNNFDHPDSIDYNLLISHIQLLKAQTSIKRPVYSYITCSRQHETIEVMPSKIMLLDGLLALTNERLRQLIDVKIFLEVSESKRLERIIERDTLERGRAREAIITRFYQTVQPMHESYVQAYKHFADIHIDANNEKPEVISSSLIHVIKNILNLPNY